MKDKRVIRIRDPRLRKIRNEFRKLWSAVDSSIWRRLRDEMEKLRHDEGGKLLGANEMEDKGTLNRFRSLQSKQQDLRMDFELSICMCATCGQLDVDMYYNKTYDAWFCLECVKLYKRMHPMMKKKYANKDPVYYDFDEEFGESFL
ncbi:MAG: hypothetical protein ACTSV5_06345 [Promethearchaeota archaeon]